MPTDPHSPINRRISIIVMNREAEDRLLGSIARRGGRRCAKPTASQAAPVDPAPR